LSDLFNFKLFKLYSDFKVLIKSLELINYYHFNSYSELKHNYPKPKLNLSNNRNYSTYTNIEPEIDPVKEFYKNRDKAIKQFKKTYKGGYLGYNQIYHFGNITDFSHLSGKDFQINYLKIQGKIKEFLK